MTAPFLLCVFSKQIYSFKKSIVYLEVIRRANLHVDTTGDDAAIPIRVRREGERLPPRIIVRTIDPAARFRTHEVIVFSTIDRIRSGNTVDEVIGRGRRSTVIAQARVGRSSRLHGLKLHPFRTPTRIVDQRI